MSLKGESNKVSGDIRRAIQRIAGSQNSHRDGTPIGTKKIFGYVCKINEDGDLAGTVDVQEFNYDPDEYDYEGAGHHKGVLLSAIQDNESGYLIVPQLFSEVVIIQNPSDRMEYVIMYSHAKRMNISTLVYEGDDEDCIEIGVTEVEKYNETNDGLDKDLNELEPTKNKAYSKYNSKSIIDQVTSPDDEEGLRQEKTFEHKIITVGDTKIVIDGENVTIETSGKVQMTVGESVITETDGKVVIDTKEAEVNADKATINGKDTYLTGGTLHTKGQANTDLNGPYNPIKVCPFSGAPHCGSIVTGT